MNIKLEDLTIYLEAFVPRCTLLSTELRFEIPDFELNIPQPPIGLSIPVPTHFTQRSGRKQCNPSSRLPPLNLDHKGPISIHKEVKNEITPHDSPLSVETDQDRTRCPSTINHLPKLYYMPFMHDLSYAKTITRGRILDAEISAISHIREVVVSYSRLKMPDHILRIHDNSTGEKLLNPSYFIFSKHHHEPISVHGVECEKELSNPIDEKHITSSSCMDDSSFKYLFSPDPILCPIHHDYFFNIHNIPKPKSKKKYLQIMNEFKRKKRHEKKRKVQRGVQFMHRSFHSRSEQHNSPIILPMISQHSSSSQRAKENSLYHDDSVFGLSSPKAKSIDSLHREFPPFPSPPPLPSSHIPFREASLLSCVESLPSTHFSHLLDTYSERIMIITLLWEKRQGCQIVHEKILQQVESHLSKSKMSSLTKQSIHGIRLPMSQHPNKPESEFVSLSSDKTQRFSSDSDLFLYVHPITRILPPSLSSNLSHEYSDYEPISTESKSKDVLFPRISEECPFPSLFSLIFSSLSSLSLESFCVDCDRPVCGVCEAKWGVSSERYGVWNGKEWRDNDNYLNYFKNISYDGTKYSNIDKTSRMSFPIHVPSRFPELYVHSSLQSSSSGEISMRDSGSHVDQQSDPSISDIPSGHNIIDLDNFSIPLSIRMFHLYSMFSNATFTLKLLIESEQLNSHNLSEFLSTLTKDKDKAQSSYSEIDTEQRFWAGKVTRIMDMMREELDICHGPDDFVESSSVHTPRSHSISSISQTNTSSDPTTVTKEQDSNEPFDCKSRAVSTPRNSKAKDISLSTGGKKKKSLRSKELKKKGKNSMLKSSGCHSKRTPSEVLKTAISKSLSALSDSLVSSVSHISSLSSSLQRLYFEYEQTKSVHEKMKDRLDRWLEREKEVYIWHQWLFKLRNESKRRDNDIIRFELLTENDHRDVEERKDSLLFTGESDFTISSNASEVSRYDGNYLYSLQCSLMPSSRCWYRLLCVLWANRNVLNRSSHAFVHSYSLQLLYDRCYPLYILHHPQYSKLLKMRGIREGEIISHLSNPSIIPCGGIKKGKRLSLKKKKTVLPDMDSKAGNESQERGKQQDVFDIKDSINSNCEKKDEITPQPVSHPITDSSPSSLHFSSYLLSSFSPIMSHVLSLSSSSLPSIGSNV
ncbi:hypothetical protein ADUPG1_009952, partial [Aduncisulcus paluster]